MNRTEGLEVMAAEIGGGFFSASLYGPHAIAARVRITAALTGRKATRADAAWTKFFALIRETFAPDALCTSAAEREIDAVVSAHNDAAHKVAEQLYGFSQRREIGEHSRQEFESLTGAELSVARRVIARLSVAAGRDSREQVNAMLVIRSAFDVVAYLMESEDRRRDEKLSGSSL